MTDRERLQRILHEQIPISRAMGVGVVALHSLSLELSAPLAANHNHAGTGFAGSLYSLASLAGWALLRQYLESHGMKAQLLLADARIRYLRPATGDFSVISRMERAQASELLAALCRGRKPRLELKIRIRSGGHQVASFTGSYAAAPVSD